MRKESNGISSSDDNDSMKLKTAFWEPEFWFGYHRGLSRHLYGDIFGNQDVHHRWHDIPDDLEDEPSIELVARGKGYRAGYAGLTVEEAAMGIKEFVNILKKKYGPEATET